MGEFKFSISFNLCTSIMENNIDFNFLYWDDDDLDEDIPKKDKKDTFSDSLEDDE